ncbi:MAG TPA: FtsQ-type POTRA domain-containing protein [Candidatus Saccharimonadales bacterium]|nr:FtsQ-type POTRA domain-containing protein [Candidatus Saccharimonadales bacterium]
MIGPGDQPTIRVGHTRRTRPIRRASAGLSPLRAGAVLVMLLSALGIYGVGASSAFAFRRLDFDAGTSPFTDSVTVLATLGLTGSPPNLFQVRTDVLAARLVTLPAVTQATVSVSLPDTIVVRVVERQPILVWAVGQKRLLVDRSGFIFAAAVPGGAGTGLPTIVDHRAASAALDVGSSLDPVDLDASTRLASLKPADLGSAARALHVTIEDSDGYEVRGDGQTWVAAFGFYTPSLRTPDLIPGQVRLLRSLLAGREDTIRRVVLADAQNGTYTTK